MRAAARREFRYRQRCLISMILLPTAHADARLKARMATTKWYRTHIMVERDTGNFFNAYFHAADDMYRHAGGHVNTRSEDDPAHSLILKAKAHSVVADA